MMLAGSKKTGNILWDTLRSPDVSLMPTGAFLSTPMKLGTKLLLAGSAVAAVGAASYMGGQKQALSSSQKAIAAAPTNYNFYQTPGGGAMTINQPSGGVASTDQKTNQTATQLETGGIMSILMIAAVVMVLMMFRK